MNSLSGKSTGQWQAQIRDQVRSMLTDPHTTLNDDDHLIELGLDSFKLMRLVNEWRKSGVKVSFGQLIERPCLRDWWALLRCNSADQDDEDTSPPHHFDKRAPFALTDVQHAYWIGRGDEQILGGVGCHAYLELDGRGLDPERLRTVWRQLLTHHGMLRAHFDEQGYQVIPAITEPEAASFTLHDLSALSQQSVDAALRTLREQLSHRRLRVEYGEVIGLALSLLPEGRTRLHLDIDLLVADVQSLQIIIRDLAALYADDVTPPAPIDWHFGEHLAVQQENRARELPAAEGYWRKRMDDFPGTPLLPLSTVPEAIQKPRFRRRSYHLSNAIWANILRYAATARVTPAMVLAAAYAEVLAKWSAVPRFLLNVPLFDRHGSEPGLGQVVADFTNLLLLEIDCRQPLSFGDRVRALQAQFHADVAHSALSGIRIQRELAQRNQGERTFAPVVFACNLETPLLEVSTQKVLGQLNYMISQTPQVWLDHQVYKTEDGILLAWDAVDSLFQPGVIDAMFDAYIDLLNRLGRNAVSWRQLANVQLPASQQAVRDRVNATDIRFEPRTLHSRFFGYAVRQPAQVALVDGASGRQIGYGELARRALQVAALLRRHGIPPQAPVAVTLPRGVSQVVAVLGILAAGACYVPVGTGQPLMRRQRIHQRAAIRYVLTDSAHLAGLASLTAVRIDIDDADALTPLAEPVAVSADSPAYIIFTSGSTGEPKGVTIRHCSAANTLDDLNQRYGVTSADRMLALAALDFDLSVYDIFGVLGAGGSLVLPDETMYRDAGAWLSLAETHRVTLWNSVPVLLDMLLVAAEGEDRQVPLRLVMVSGDWINPQLAVRLAQRAPAAQMLAMGGATEASIWSNLYEVHLPLPAHWRALPYGRPLANQRYRVVNSQGQDCPDWVTGELWIGGAGVAQGYCGDEQRTAGSFVSREGMRWYRTGDLGRYWPDGTLEFLGREDHQIKLRGHRIELGEIESALRGLPGVRQAVALVTGEPAMLAAALACGQALDSAAAAAALRELLPEYMVPTRWLMLDTLPLSANGKVDRQRLIARCAEYQNQIVSKKALPESDIERQVAAVWGQLLGRQPVYLDDHFFQMGGDSLLATQVVAQLQREGLCASRPLRQLFARPVLRDFSIIWQKGPHCLPEAARLSPDPSGRYQPFDLTEIQHAYWMGQLGEFSLRCGTHYLIELDGENISLARIDRAWRALWLRHDMLRACVDDEGRQSVAPVIPPNALQIASPAADVHAAKKRISAYWQQRDRSRTVAPLHSLYAVPYGDNRCRLGMFFDYLTLDGYSIKLLLSELITLFQDESALPPLQLSFRDYVTQVAVDNTIVEDAQRYWGQRLDELPPAPALPFRQEPATIGTAEFSRLQTRLSASDWACLRHAIRERGLTPSALLLTVYAHVLSQWSGGGAHTLNLTLFDRRDLHPDVQYIVGDFTTLAPVAFQPDADASLRHLVSDMQAQVAEVLEHRAVSSVWIQRERARKRGLQAAALPVVFTSTLGLVDDFLSNIPDGFPDLADGGLSETPQVWLDYQVFEHHGELVLCWDFEEKLFPDGMLNAMFDTNIALLGQLVWDDAAWSAPLPSLIPASQQVVRDRVNATDIRFEPRTLHSRFFGYAARQPAQVALVDGASGRQIGYGELARRALQVAALLRRHGIPPQAPVAVTLPRGVSQVVAVLGILAAGACYVPVGTGQPLMRRQRIHQRAAIRYVLTDSAHLAGLASLTAVRIDIGDADALTPLAEPVAVSADSPAYIIFTSGSTGEPKGVTIRHCSAANTLDDLNQRYGVTSADRMLALAALDFDLSVYDIFGVLGAGGSLVLPDETMYRDAGAWLSLAETHRVTLWNSVPVLLDMLLVAAEGEDRQVPLRLVMVSGDWINPQLAVRLAQRAPAAQMLAMGGATEASIWSNLYEVHLPLPAHWRALPYGRPLANQRYRVVNSQGQDCPDWVTGELWIGGAGVAQGYCGDEQRTAGSFVSREGMRWYRTGDLGRYWPDGTLEFLGREDHQIKLRGHRIELGEIESALRGLPGVRQAVALVTGEPAMLAAALACGQALDSAAAAAALRELLPEYMVPTRWLMLETLPLSANGKVDRRALAERCASIDALRTFDAPLDDIEEKIAAVWAQVLGYERVSRHDDFFLLGGDSLRATRLVEALRRQPFVSGPLSLHSIFAAPTVAEQAALLCAAHASQPDTASVMDNSFEEGML
ncbi:amino acid adenylation domain-containing protein [Affinibrenneria salicis]|uniref:Amino acid adenylation domain-containing protein n=1 Tax=Affinibrenneria salicis TaxID=2590031 RepID=A0A5J5FTT6_9GAMM|nr:non-ribosomal peptide synthetase [Affinibrenneria salicis]KAA8996659.1 amino acid adenylation domain-containing protein [Affinibrenneria salicis]